MRRVRWEAEARVDFREALSYLVDRDPEAARLVAGRLRAAIRLLAEHPIGRPSRTPDVFAKKVAKTSYIVFYRATSVEVTIVRVVHGRRDWPRSPRKGNP